MKQLYDALHIAVGALLFVIAAVFLIQSVREFHNTVDGVGHTIESVDFGEKTDCSEKRTMLGYELLELKNQYPPSEHILHGHGHITRNKTYEVEFLFDSNGKLTKANYR